MRMRGESVAAVMKTGTLDDTTRAALVSGVGDLAKELAAGARAQSGRVMSGKLSEVESRIGTVHQLEAVITAMRGSAAARSREARSRLDGIRAYAAAIGAAIGQALALAPESDPQPRKLQSVERHVVIVLSSEQGFAGTFNERVLDAAERHLKADGIGAPDRR